MFTDSMIPFWIAVGSIATALAVIVGIMSWLRPRSQAFKLDKAPRLAVRRVLHPDDEDLNAAYEVYKQEIDNAHERDSFADIQRWLTEAEQARKTASKAKPLELDEYLLIGKLGPTVCAFFYGQYYRDQRMFLVGYLAKDRKSPDSKRATSLEIAKYLVHLLNKHHPECAGVIFELALEPQKNPRIRTGKEELFAMHAVTAAKVVFKRLDINYKQPKLSLWNPSLTEQRQHLVYGRMSGPPLTSHISKQEASHVLDAVYNCWYGDYYLDDPSKDAEYRHYVRSIYEAAVSSLPAQVALI